MWESIKRFFTSIFDYLGEAGQYLVTAVLLIILAVVSIFIIQNWVGPASRPTTTPDLAENLDPSIGEALPPDVNIDVVTSPDGGDTKISSAPTDNQNKGTVNGEVTEFIAPPTGLDPSKPIAYYNDKLNFRLTIPPKSVVQEHSNTVNFYSEHGKLLATVTVVTSPESLADIKGQLSLSPDISDLHDVEFYSKPALKYQQKQLPGYALKNNDQIYYFTGQSDILKQLSI